jgi:hypothetical protein
MELLRLRLQSSFLHAMPLIYILILSSRLRLVSASGLFPSSFLIKRLYDSSSQACYMPENFVLFHLSTWQYLVSIRNKMWHLFWSFLQPPVRSTFTVFDVTCPFRNMRAQVSHQYGTTDKIIILYILWHVNALPGNSLINIPRYAHATIGQMFIARC